MRALSIPAALLALTFASPAWSGPEEDLQGLRAESIAIPGAEVTEYPDFTMVIDPSGLAIHYFTKPSHYAHPAAVYRAIVQEGGAWVVRYSAVYYG